MTSENSNNPQAPINVVSYVHPDNRRDFRAISTPKSVVKQAKGRISHVCEVCASEEKDGVKLLQCARCKTAWYCSKECQKEHWPGHKTVCRKVESATSKFISNLIANSLLVHHIQLALVFHYNLNEKPKPESPLIARCDLSIIPSDLTYVIRSQTDAIPAEELEKGTEGMLQIKSISELDPAQALDSTQMEMWRATKKGLEENGHHSEHAIVVYFYLPNVAQGTAVSMPIHQETIERANSGKGFERKSAILPTIYIPLSMDACIDFINTHIRSDKRNQLSLRTHMSKEEVEKYLEQLISEESDS